MSDWSIFVAFGVKQIFVLNLSIISTSFMWFIYFGNLEGCGGHEWKNEKEKDKIKSTKDNCKEKYPITFFFHIVFQDPSFLLIK